MSPTGSNSKRRLACRIGAVSAAVACSAAFASPALAGDGPALPELPEVPDVGTLADSLVQQTNIPNLAWRGESVRLVECAPVIDDASVNFIIPLLTNATMQVEDWTGDPHFKPVVQNSSAVPFTNEKGQVCIAGNLTSQRAGLAAVKISVTDLTQVLPDLPEFRERALDDLENAGILDIIGNKAVLQRQALVGWMNIGETSMENLGDGDTQFGAEPEESTPAADTDQEMKVKVKGVLPLKGEWGEQINSDAGLPDPGEATRALELPGQYGEMADALAESAANISNEANRLLWDVHDSDAEGASENCALTTRLTNPGADPTGDCGTGNEVGSFSRVLDVANTIVAPLADKLGLNSGLTIGPFDPQRGNATSLGDGLTDEDDANMPALRIDFALGQDDVGSLVPSNKSETFLAPFLHDNDNAPAGGHSLFAPFYRQYIPATAAPFSDASGVDGPPTGRGFPGFLVNNSEYDNWDTYSRSAATGDETSCLKRFEQGAIAQALLPAPNGYFADTRNEPIGDRAVTTYTDEHGETRVAYDPGMGAWFDDLIAAAKATPSTDDDILNGNGGCDLEDVVLGDATISATALYPYTPIQAKGIPIDQANIEVDNLFEKGFTITRKSGNGSNTSTYVATLTARDIDGSPFANERVCIDVLSGFPAPGFPDVSVPGYDDSTWQCTRTNSQGVAKVEFSKGINGDREYTASFVDEAIMRHNVVDLDTVPPAPVEPSNPGGGPQPPQGPQGPGPVPPGNDVKDTPQTPQGQQAQQQVRQASLQVVSAGGAKKVAATLASSKVVRTSSGKRVLKVRVNSAARTAKVKVHLRGRGGRTVRLVTLSVPTNREVTVNLAISKAVRSVKAKVVS